MAARSVQYLHIGKVYIRQMDWITCFAPLFTSEQLQLIHHEWWICWDDILPLFIDFPLNEIFLLLGYRCFLYILFSFLNDFCVQMSCHSSVLDYSYSWDWNFLTEIWPLRMGWFQISGIRESWSLGPELGAMLHCSSYDRSYKQCSNMYSNDANSGKFGKTSIRFVLVLILRVSDRFIVWTSVRASVVSWMIYHDSNIADTYLSNLTNRGLKYLKAAHIWNIHEAIHWFNIYIWYHARIRKTEKINWTFQEYAKVINKTISNNLNIKSVKMRQNK